MELVGPHHPSREPQMTLLELALQRSIRQLGLALSISEDLGRHSLMQDLEDIKYFLQHALHEVQESKPHRKIVGQMVIQLPPPSSSPAA